MTHRLAFFLVMICIVALSTACARTQSAAPVDNSSANTPVPSPTATAEKDPAGGPGSTPVPTPEPSPTPVATPDAAPTPTPTPEAARHRVVSESDCCGLFEWLDQDRLMIFDERESGESGSFIVNASSGHSEYLSPGYGMSSESGAFAMIEPGRSDLIVRNELGEEVAGIATDGTAGWPSPDGTKIAWLEPRSVRTPSSSVNREVRLNVAEISTGSVSSPIDLQAQMIEWLPDSQHVIAAGRMTDFEHPGIWLIDTVSGEISVLHEETFLRAVRVSPDGSQVAFMRLFNEDPADNGLWILDIESGVLTPVFDSGSYRWDPESRDIWRLHMGATGAHVDVLERYSLEAGEIVETVELEGQILNEQWEISPDGKAVAFWRWEDGLIVVQDLE